MSNANTASSSERDELVDALKQEITNLLTIKARLPVQKAIVREFERCAPEGWDGINDALLQIVRDSFDMLVIDLFSLRERLVNDGLFNRLVHHLPLFRTFTEDDCRGRQFIGNAARMSPAELEKREKPHRVRLIDGWNDTLVRLFPAGAPVSEAHVQDLIKRFRKDTQPTHKDRNQVRAHAFEKHVNEKYRQNLTEVEAQIKVFERYLNDLYLVLDKAVYSMHPMTYANPERTARDIVALILRDGRPVRASSSS